MGRLSGNEGIDHGPHAKIFSSDGSRAKSTVRIVGAGSVLECSSHGVGAVLCRRSVLSALRHHAVTVQRLADTPGSWDKWTLPERNIGTNGDGDTRHDAPAGS